MGQNESSRDSAVATFEDYAAQRFPNHRIRERQPTVAMTKHTTVVEVKGARTASEIANRLRLNIPYAHIGLALVLPNDSTVVASGCEDKEGSIDVPRKRLAVVGAAGAIALGGIGLLVAREVVGNWTGAVIAGVFLAIIGAVVGALLGGLGRYAGSRAWEQQRQGDDVIGLVAVCLDDEESAKRAAVTLEELGLIDVRIVGEDGAWHVPNT